MASILKVDTIQDQSGNNIINENADTITIGASGDTVDVPGTEVKTNKVSPTSGTTLTLGDSGDTITIPSGATIDASGATITLPTTIEVDTIEPKTATTLTLGASGDTITIPSGATITNSGTATGFGKVLQVVSTVKTDTFTTSSLSYTDVTGLSVSITPSSASNKILILGKVSVGINTGTNRAGVLLVRDSTDIFKGDVAGSRTYASSAVRSSDSADIEDVSFVFLDSPATTSSTTYKIKCTVVISGSIFINRSNTDTNSSNFFRTASSITVMEIAG